VNNPLQALDVVVIDAGRVGLAEDAEPVADSAVTANSDRHRAPTACRAVVRPLGLWRLLSLWVWLTPSTSLSPSPSL
jgi:hypothetical protein